MYKKLLIFYYLLISLKVEKFIIIRVNVNLINFRGFALRSAAVRGRSQQLATSKPDQVRNGLAGLRD